MENLSHSESRRLYSWWWDSHNTPKNSKWLQDNITDMDGRVKSMIKLIEEDADSFARRAEMYYKKRPELMKLVEEFYRAYRALAERYNHATGELRHAHRTIARAFPDQVPFELVEDSPSKSSAQDWEPSTLLDADDLSENKSLSVSDVHSEITNEPHKEESDGGMKKRALKQSEETFGSRETKSPISNSSDIRLGIGHKNEREKDQSSQDAVLQLSTENQSLKDKFLSETERAGQAEREVFGLKKALADMEAEKEDIIHQYRQCLEKLPKIEGELSNAQMDSMKLIEKASRAEIEVQTLKEALVQLESEKIAGMVKHEAHLEKISHLESMASQLHEDMKALNNRTFEAESQAQALKDEMSTLGLEKEAVVCCYKQCLGKISELENIISSKEDEARMLKKQTERAESEVLELKKAIADLNKQKEVSALQYKHCLEKISKLEKEISTSKDEVEHLNNLVLIGTSKLKTTEEKCNMLAMSNQTLRVEADNLATKIKMKDQELLNKQEELEKLQFRLRDENTRHAQVVSTLETLQNLHAQSQDDQRALALELRNMLRMLEDVEANKHGLEEELHKVRDENCSLGEASFCSSVSMENMQKEVLSLREIRERLEKGVSHHVGISISLQHDILCLKEEIELLNKSYQALVEQVEAAGLNPKCLGTSIKSLQDENSKLKQMQEQDYSEKEILLKKLENIEEVLKKKMVAERSLSELNGEMQMSQEKMKALQESCQLLHGEKATLVAEKASLLSQLQSITENMNNLLGQNAVLEHSLSAAKVELEGLREKSRGLEEICNLLKNERSFLLSERDNLVLKLENVERKLESLEKKHTRLGEKCANLEKENEAMHFQVETLKASLCDEKQDRIGSQLLSDKMAGLENEIHLLQEESRWKKKESEQELEKVLKAQFEISILQKFIKDMENKNSSLIIECQKHVEASNLAEKVISELESESLEQQVEAELLLDEIRRLRSGIYQIFSSVESCLDCAPEDEVENDLTLVDLILGGIQDMKHIISKHEDERQQLFVENSVLEALLEQLKSKGTEIELQKLHLDRESKIIAEKLAIVNNEKELFEINRKLKSDASKGFEAAAELQAEFGSLCVKQGDLETAYNALQDAYSQAKQENASLLKKSTDLIEDKCRVNQHNDDMLLEFLAAVNQSAVLKSFAVEKIMELKSLLEDLNRQHEVNSWLRREMSELEGKLDLQKAENLVLRDAVCSLEREMQEVRERDVQMKQDMKNTTKSLIQTKTKLFDTEMHLEATEKLNSTLFRTVAELRIDVQRSQQIREDLERNMVQLSETNSSQGKEIQSLHIVNKNLESELGLLHQEIEENIVREQTLNIELQGMNNEFELCESEAASFCFDLQVSSVQEVLLKDKVQELTGVCQTLEQKHAAKTSEIEQMKGEICLMEKEINRLKSQVSAYAPIIALLKDDITLIEHNALLHSKRKAAHSQGTEFLEFAADRTEATSQTPLEDQSLLSLQNLQMRVKAVGKLMEEAKKPVFRRRSKSKRKQEPVTGKVNLSEMQSTSGRDRQKRSSKKSQASELNDSPGLQKLKSKGSEVRNMMRMKDIPLDQASDGSMRKKGNTGFDDLMLELWETVEDGIRDQTVGESIRMPHTSKEIFYNQVGCIKGKSEVPSTDSDMERELGVDKVELSSGITESDPEPNDKNILERLASDAEKLESLQTTLYDFRRKLETNRKNRKAKYIDFETIKEQLQEAEDTLVHLVDLNVQLVKNIEECPPDDMASPRMKETVKAWRIKVMEQAQKGSERLDMLQLTVQKIQFMLSKQDDDCKNKENNKFPTSRTVILRDFIYIGKRNNGRRKTGPSFGCFKQSTSFNRSR